MENYLQNIKQLDNGEFEINIENPIDRATYILKKGYSVQKYGV